MGCVWQGDQIWRDHYLGIITCLIKGIVMIKEKIVVPGQIPPAYRVCWSAIFAGAFTGLGLAFLLHCYGLAIGLSAFSSSAQGASLIAIGGLLGVVLGVIAAMAASGFVAGYLGRFHYFPHNGGVIYGFVTWSMVLFLSAIMLTPLEHYASDYKNALLNTTVTETRHDDGKKIALKEHKASPVKKETAVSSEQVLSADQLAWGGWLVFGLFFIGAVSSCVGASCGMRCKRGYC